MAKENKSRYAVLGMLSLGPMSGYDIKKVIEDRFLCNRKRVPRRSLRVGDVLHIYHVRAHTPFPQGQRPDLYLVTSEGNS